MLRREGEKRGRGVDEMNTKTKLRRLCNCGNYFIPTGKWCKVCPICLNKHKRKKKSKTFLDIHNEKRKRRSEVCVSV
jgi:hypothetical protein